MNVYKYEVGSKHKGLKITDRKIENGGNFYKFECQKCGYDCGRYYDRKAEEWKEEYWKREGDIERKGCPVCTSRFVVKDINSVYHTHPELVKYFANREDTYTHTSSSTRPVRAVCPDCGRLSDKLIKVDIISKHGGYKCLCRDNISYPEKYMLGLLESVCSREKDVSFIYQARKNDFAWAGKYIYDFAVFIHGKTIIVEAQGIQHYKATFKGQDIERTRNEDEKKRRRAIEQGNISPEDYIMLDCAQSDPDYIRDNIISSGLKKRLALVGDDFDNANKNTKKNLTTEICAFYTDHLDMTLEEIAEHFHLCRPTITNTLVRGAKLDLCAYSKPYITYYNSASKNHDEQPITVFNPITKRGMEYLSIKDAVMKNSEWDHKMVARCCSCERIMYKKMVMVYGRRDDVTSKFNRAVRDYVEGDSLTALSYKYGLRKDLIENLLKKAEMMGLCELPKQDSPNKGRRGPNYLAVVEMMKENSDISPDDIAQVLGITRENASAHIQEAYRRGDITRSVLDSRDRVDYKATGEHLKRLLDEYRRSMGYTMEQIAEMLGLACVQTLYRCFAGASLPKRKTLVTMARMLGVESDYLLIIKPAMEC